ncbi:MAG: DUF2156 domain-containing protein [Lentisphaeria bacterium]|nr:DUF2156 domain-containing protein [Lentisphaeria bacterium]
MELNFEHLRPVEFSDRAFLQSALAAHPEPRSCECAEANLFLWQKSYGEMFLPVEGRFWVLETRSGIPHFPIGKPFAPADLYDLARQAAAHGFKAEFYDVPESYAADPEVLQFFDAEADEDEFDYLYDLTRQAEMTGPKLRKKRNLVRQFERNYPGAALTGISDGDLAEALDLALRLNRALAPADFLTDEAAAMAEISRCFSKLDMGGVLLKLADGTPAGISVFSRMADGETFDIHFEKADHTIKGAPQFLTAGTAEYLLAKGGKWMNREQDMGEPGLRQAKRSLDPDRMIRRFYLTAKKEV